MIKFSNSTFSVRFGGSATTDDQGRFELNGLVPGEEYVIQAVIEIGPEGFPKSWRRIGTVKATKEVQDVGTLKLGR